MGTVAPSDTEKLKCEFGRPSARMWKPLECTRRLAPFRDRRQHRAETLNPGAETTNSTRPKNVIKLNGAEKGARRSRRSAFEANFWGGEQLAPMDDGPPIDPWSSTSGPDDKLGGEFYCKPPLKPNAVEESSALVAKQRAPCLALVGKAKERLEVEKLREKQMENTIGWWHWHFLRATHFRSKASERGKR